MWVLLRNHEVAMQDLVSVTSAPYIGMKKGRCHMEVDVPWWLILLIVFGVAIVVYVVGLV